MTGKRWCSRVLSAIGVLALAYMVLNLALHRVLPSTYALPIECTVVNNSTEVLERVAVTVFGHTYGAEGLPPGASFTFTFDAHGDDHYHVVAQPASGNRLVSDVGYVTTGLQLKDRIEIRADEVRFTTTQE